MQRIVRPEILDTLPEDHPAAVANRRDLRLINRLMGNYRWFCRVLPPLLRSGDSVLELGAGTGELGLRLRAVCGDRIGRYRGVDLWKRPDGWPANWEWSQEDLLELRDCSDFTVIVANLILHQFGDSQLRRLGERLTSGRARLILASEPARHRLHQRQLLLLRPLGLHPVSRHDGHVSVAGGFRGDELAQLLGIAEPPWRVRTRSGFFGWNRTIAVRAI